jgi:hypothetical protein
MDNFSDICIRFWNLEHKLKCSARTANIMAAIDLEASVNMFCFFNLGEITTDAIENLPLPGKLTVIHRVLGLSDFKGTKPYEAVRSLVNWRNAFAHGKCTDMPIRSIKVNHLTKPKELAESRDIVRETLELLHRYVVVCTHLRKISKHPYTSGYLVQLDEIEQLLGKIQTFRFIDGLTIEKIKVQTKK